MMNQVRKQKIAEYINEKGAAGIKELNALFPEVSVMTIHRDLEKLEQEGNIIRTRGGAISGKRQLSATETSLTTRENTNADAKIIIAKKAAQLIEEGNSIFIDAGTTALALAREMPDIELNIFTTAPNIAIELSRLEHPTIYMCGGMMNKANLAVSGTATLQMLENVNITIAFIGVSGYSADAHFTCGKEEEKQVKQQVMAKAFKNVILMDDSKYGQVLPFTFGKLEDINVVVSNGKLPEEFVSQSEEEGAILI
jgi:DeoR/GlpR family transcriptional regulator of sugar metabolism